jgi:hypothetical protein
MSRPRMYRSLPMPVSRLDAHPDEDQHNDNVVDLTVPPIAVNQIDGDLLTDLAVALFRLEGKIASMLNARLDDVPDSFMPAVRNRLNQD